MCATSVCSSPGGGGQRGEKNKANVGCHFEGGGLRSVLLLCVLSGGGPCHFEVGGSIWVLLVADNSAVDGMNT